MGVCVCVCVRVCDSDPRAPCLEAALVALLLGIPLAAGDDLVWRLQRHQLPLLLRGHHQVQRHGPTPPAWRSLNPQLGSNGNWGQATEQEAGSGHRRARRGVRPPSQSDPPAAQQGGCTIPPTTLAQGQSDCTIPPNHQPASRSLPPPCHIAVRRAPAYDATLSPLACRRGRLGRSCRRAGRRRRRIITMWFSRRSARRRREGILGDDDGWVLQGSASDLFVQRIHL